MYSEQHLSMRGSRSWQKKQPTEDGLRIAPRQTAVAGVRMLLRVQLPVILDPFGPEELEFTLAKDSEAPVKVYDRAITRHPRKAGAWQLEVYFSTAGRNTVQITVTGRGQRSTPGQKANVLTASAKVMVQPGDACAERSTLIIGQSIVASTRAAVCFELKDRFGNLTERAAKGLKLEAAAGDGEPRVHMLQPDVQTALLDLTAAGHHTVGLSLGGTELQGSPAKVQVVAAAPDAAHCIVTPVPSRGSCIKAELGHPAKLSLQVCDQFGNQCNRITPELEAFIRPAGAQVQVSCSCTLGGTAVVELVSTRTAPTEEIVMLHLLLNIGHELKILPHFPISVELCSTASAEPCAPEHHPMALADAERFFWRTHKIVRPKTARPKTARLPSHRSSPRTPKMASTPKPIKGSIAPPPPKFTPCSAATVHKGSFRKLLHTDCRTRAERELHSHGGAEAPNPIERRTSSLAEDNLRWMSRTDSMISVPPELKWRPPTTPFTVRNNRHMVHPQTNCFGSYNEAPPKAAGGFVVRDRRKSQPRELNKQEIERNSKPQSVSKYI